MDPFRAVSRSTISAERSPVMGNGGEFVLGARRAARKRLDLRVKSKGKCAGANLIGIDRIGLAVSD
ncbi:hypothetical protein DAH93_05715 [Sphingomonas koreensis]|nr:hypothetical protein CA229_01315 [Sphingomonas koreensis]RSX47685.1 hypothetical protein DAH93_05715 [Sphingomonas koreensis]RSX97921.1 hypothetical protein DAH87_08130 [Sphingomonas koreensis]